jgi:hypothetical protein
LGEDAINMPLADDGREGGVTMQQLDIHRPEMPDLQFVLLVTALCTSRLTMLNIPTTLRTTIFDRCWVLIHDSPPPRRMEARLLDLQPWTELTVEAMAETIRRGLSEAGIHTLMWDHPPSEPTRLSIGTPEALIFVDRLSDVISRPSDATDTASAEVVADAGAPEEKGPDVLLLLGEMAALMAKLTPALERRAANTNTKAKPEKLADMLRKGAELMHGSGNMFQVWARYYAELRDDTAS